MLRLYADFELLFLPNSLPVVLAEERRRDSRSTPKAAVGWASLPASQGKFGQAPNRGVWVEAVTDARPTESLRLSEKSHEAKRESPSAKHNRRARAILFC
jgi:hypothetical protein